MSIFPIHYNWDKIYNALDKKENIAFVEIKSLEKRIIKEHISFFTILDDFYPDAFKSVYKPPFIIFYKGNKELIKHKNIYCFTGNNIKNEYVNNNIKTLFNNKIDGYISINSLHKGIEELIYEKESKDNNTIFICADNINKPESAIDINNIDLNNSLIISEYYENEHVTKKSLRARNRLIVALSKSIILISSDKKSWTNNLVTHALNAGKDIYCMQDNPKNLSGNTELIKEGANLLTSMSDLV